MTKSTDGNVETCFECGNVCVYCNAERQIRKKMQELKEDFTK